MDARRVAIYANVQALAGAEPVIWADQNAPRPDGPYWTIRLSTRTVIGDSFGQTTDGAGALEFVGVRTDVLEIQRIGPDSFDALANAQEVLNRITSRDAWRANFLIIADIGKVANAPYRRDGSTYEARASLDVFLRYAVKYTDTVGFFDAVTVSDDG